MRIRQTGLSRIGLIGLIILNLTLLSVATTAQAAERVYFPQTGHSVSGKFLQYWQQNGGLSVYGYPITDPQNEVDPETGRIFLTQWFERNRFELHPEYAGTQYEVLLGLLGKDLRRQALPIQREFVPTVPLISSTEPSQFFASTSHNVSGKFLAYWQQNGGLTRFGYPLDEPHYEIDSQTNQPFMTQWFERARFELHPDNQPPYDVLLGLLGNEIKRPKVTPLQFNWRIEGSEALFINTRGLAVDSKGNFYIAADEQYINSHLDGFVSKPLFSNLIFKFDKTGQLITKWGGPGEFSIFGATAIDAQDNLYVGDYDRGQVQKFDPTGNLLLKWGAFGQADGQFMNISGLALDRQGNSYVLDSSLSRVQKFDAKGKFLTKWGTNGSGDGQFNTPRSITVDENGQVYVSDNRNFRVQKFDSEGHFLLKWGSQGIGDGQFGFVPYQNHNPEYGGPTSIVSGGGLIYVTDWSNARIEKFDSNGQFLQSWTNVSHFDPNLFPYLGLGGDGSLYTVATNQVEHYDASKNLLSQQVYTWNSLHISGFSRIRTDGQNNLYVHEIVEKGERLTRLNPAGQVISSFDPNSGSSQVCDVRDEAIDATGQLFILCDDSVRVFDQTGHFLRGWGSSGSGNGQFGFTSSLALDSQGQVYVADDSRRIQKFDTSGHFLKSWSFRNKDNTQNLLINDLVIDQAGLLYAATDLSESTVQISDLDGVPLKRLDVRAYSLALDAHNDLLVFDGTNQLSKYQDGLPVWSYSNQQTADGSLGHGSRIAADRQGNVYLNSAGSLTNIQKLHDPSIS